MKASELRLPNLIIDRHKEVVEVRLTRILHDYYDEEYMNDHFSPIPLTEEWLLKFGFRKIDAYNCYILNGLLRYNVDNNKWFIETPDGPFESYWVEVPLTYVHQLQNLYFALTGEELTVK